MGTHLYDWLRLFGGDVEWTHAHLVQLDGRESTVDDIKHTQEVHPHDRDAGLVLGERGHASLSASRTAATPMSSSSRSHELTITPMA